MRRVATLPSHRIHARQAVDRRNESSVAVFRVLPRSANAGILKFGLFLCIINRLMPSVRQCFPNFVAAEKIVRILSFVFANGQSSRRTHQHAGDNLPTISGVPVPLVNRRIQHNFRAAYLFWNTHRGSLALQSAKLISLKVPDSTVFYVLDTAKKLARILPQENAYLVESSSYGLRKRD